MYSSFTTPSLRKMTLWTIFFMELLWVTMSIVVPYFALICSRRTRISLEVFESSAPVGSSQRRSLGFLMSALAKAHHCCCHPESCAGNLFRCSVRPSTSRSSSISRGSFVRYSHTCIFSVTVRLGTRL